MAIVAIQEVGNRIQWTADGRTVHTTACVEALTAELAEPHAVICEPTFYDGLVDVGRVLSGLLATHGHRLVPVGRGAKAALESAAGDKDLGSGVCRLFSIVTAGSRRLDRLRTNVESRWDVKDALDVIHGIDTISPSMLDFDLAKEAAGQYEDLAEPLRRALGGGIRYRADVLFAAYRASTVATSRNEFEQFLGLTAGSHGAMALTLRTWYVVRNTSDHFERDSVLGWSDYRRALRSLYHRMKVGRDSSLAA